MKNERKVIDRYKSKRKKKCLNVFMLHFFCCFIFYVFIFLMFSFYCFYSSRCVCIFFSLNQSFVSRVSIFFAEFWYFTIFFLPKFDDPFIQVRVRIASKSDTVFFFFILIIFSFNCQYYFADVIFYFFIFQLNVAWNNRL